MRAACLEAADGGAREVLAVEEVDAPQDGARLQVRERRVSDERQVVEPELRERLRRGHRAGQRVDALVRQLLAARHDLRTSDAPALTYVR